MERLTVKEWRNLDPWECCGQDHYCQRKSNEQGGCTGGCRVPKLYEYVARFEEAGLTGKDAAVIAELLKHSSVEHIAELLQAEKESRLAVLPCKVGADIWWIDDQDNDVKKDEGGVWGIAVTKAGIKIMDGMGGLEEIGSRFCYLTREAADAAFSGEGAT